MLDTIQFKLVLLMYVKMITLVLLTKIHNGLGFTIYNYGGENMNINSRYKRVIFALLMAFSMSCFITFILISISNGYNSLFLSTWLKTWSQAFVCAFFGAYYFPVIIQKILNKINFVESH